MAEITIPNAVELREIIVKPVGSGAQVLVPKKWLDRKVAVVLLEKDIDWGGDARTPQH